MSSAWGEEGLNVVLLYFDWEEFDVNVVFLYLDWKRFREQQHMQESFFFNIVAAA